HPASPSFPTRRSSDLVSSSSSISGTFSGSTGAGVSSGSGRTLGTLCGAGLLLTTLYPRANKSLTSRGVLAVTSRPSLLRRRTGAEDNSNSLFRVVNARRKGRPGRPFTTRRKGRPGQVGVNYEEDDPTLKPMADRRAARPGPPII